MNNIIILIYVLTILYILEYAPITLLFIYVLLIINIAILLSYINCAYISYILILVYIGAMSVLFGFVIMLIPNPTIFGFNEIIIYKYIIPIIIIFTYILYHYILDLPKNNFISISYYYDIIPVPSTMIKNIGNILYILDSHKLLLIILLLFTVLIGIFNILKIK